MSEIKAIHHPTIKDPADFHARDPNGFEAAFQALMASAAPVVAQLRLPMPATSARYAVADGVAFERARALLRKYPPAVSGQDGHGTTYRLARILWNDFGLSPAECWVLLCEWNFGLSERWTERELRHKLDSAITAGPGPEGRGFKLSEGTRSTRKRTTTTRSSSVTAARKSDASATEQTFENSDLGHSRRFVGLYGGDVRFVADQRCWFVWNGRRWVCDPSGVYVEQLVKRMIEEMTRGATERIAAAARVWSGGGTDQEKAAASAERLRAEDDLKIAVGLQKMRHVSSIIAALRSEPEILIATYAETFDRQHHLLNTATGTVDLRTGECHPHKREDFITHYTPIGFDPDAVAPRYQEFLRQIAGGNDRVVGYLRRLSGYISTGDTADQSFYSFVGDGANGKTLLVEGALTPALGSYALRVPETLLVNRGGDRHPTERADLAGIRFAYASETGESGKLDEATVKALTGGDTITARKMRKDFFRFRPTHKLVLLTNYKPKVSGLDHGIWRRMRLVSFDVRFWTEDDRAKEPDKLFEPSLRANPNLQDELREELPGILADMVRNAVEYYKNRRLITPEEVINTTASYRKEQDSIGRFITECLVEDHHGTTQSAVLHSKYVEWCGCNDIEPKSNTAFGSRMKKHFEWKYDGCVRYHAQIAMY